MNFEELRAAIDSGEISGKTRRQVIAERYQAGERMEALAAEYGVSRQRIHQLVIKAGIPIHHGRIYQCEVDDCEVMTRQIGPCPYHARRTRLGFSAWPRKPAGHGTTRKYQSGCRCDLCRKANTDQARMYRERRGAALKAGEDTTSKHGTVSTYRNFGCRCDACREVHRVHVRMRKGRPTEGLPPLPPFKPIARKKK